jgi:putative nucleotidyltransferase with HDIG domain
VAVLSAWGGSVPTQLGFLTVDASQEFSWLGIGVWTVVGGFVGGWMSSALTLIVTPVLENILDYTTDLKLLELARMDNPLLKELVMKAPGTYHHSIVVGSLVEAACEAVGVDALLARVGAYYHDIGKIGRAEYFVENQTNGRNPHDQISPHMSAKIIISHVKEGMKMATDAKLGASLMDFIQTHHGTSLVSYFYNKAKQEASQPNARLEVKEVAETDFRYPGPKPRSKEAAIMALADSCEAATRSLVDPTPARIEGMVKKILSKAFNEGLLDEAEITLAEVNTVGRAFVRILMGIHHNRIQYQDQEEGLPKRSTTLSFIKSRGSLP